MKVDYLVAGVGTGGTITGCAQYFNSVTEGSDMKVNIVGVEPKESMVLSGEKPGFHQIQGTIDCSEFLQNVDYND